MCVCVNCDVWDNLNYLSKFVYIIKTIKQNQRLTFVRQNHFKVGLYCIENRMRSITNVVDKKWMKLPIKNRKSQCKICAIQNSLESM